MNLPNPQPPLVPPKKLAALSPEAEALYNARLAEQRREVSHTFFWLFLAQWVCAMGLALFVSPRAWAGLSSTVHPHLWAAFLGGGLLISLPLYAIRTRPDATATAHLVAIAQMLFSALLIHLTGGRIETHFHIFGSLAILAFYLDSRVLLTASTLVVLDHLVRGLVAPASVYGVNTAEWWRSLEHGGWVVFEVFFLIYLAQHAVKRTFHLAAESAATQGALQASEHRLRRVLDTAYDAFVAMDHRGLIIGWNEQAEKTFGWTTQEVMGKSLAERIIPARFWAAHEEGLKRFLLTGEGPVLGQRLELSAINREGREFPVEMTVSAVPWGESHIFNAFLRDITERQENARRLEEINRHLMDASRQAGKAEVAVGVLHNVGNVLNSVNVSAGIISDTVRSSPVKILGEVVHLLQSKNDGLAEYLATDPKGQRIPELLGKVTQRLEAEHAKLIAESVSLVSHVGHIRETVALQQNNATAGGVLEKINPQTLIEDAIRLEGSAMIRHGIELEREFTEVPAIMVDRHKALQILVNLIRNAKQALTGKDDGIKRLRLGLVLGGEDRVCVTVRDNGMGIAPENLSRIFNHGFTTKAEGHGVGLHISALAAREMGGSLIARSEGPGHGATFILELPLAQAEPARDTGTSTAPVPDAAPAATCLFHSSTTP